MKNMEVTINKQTRLSEHLTTSSVATLGHSSELDGSRLSPHFTLAEMCKTNVRLKNVPNEAQVNNLKRLCGWLEMLRKRYNERYVANRRDPSATLGMTKGVLSSRLSKAHGEISEEPIVINSGYRSPAVNKAVGGVATSNHLTGCAADIRVTGMEQLIRYAAILLDYADETGEEFDELLLEKNRSGAFWLHFAVKPKGNRHKVLFISV
jgi:hypothetical protein